MFLFVGTAVVPIVYDVGSIELKLMCKIGWIKDLNLYFTCLVTANPLVTANGQLDW